MKKSYITGLSDVIKFAMGALKMRLVMNVKKIRESIKYL